MKEVNIYNGTNHAIAEYSPNLCVCNRNGEIFLKSDGIVAHSIIERKAPLNVNKNFVFENAGCINEHYFMGAASTLYTFEKPEDFSQYDVIVVSRAYAEAVLAGWNYLNQDFVDRLYVENPVYAANTQKFNGEYRKPVGTLGFKKVAYPYTLQNYIYALDNNLPINVISLKNFLEIRQRFYLSDFDLWALQRCRNYLYFWEQNQESQCYRMAI